MTDKEKLEFYELKFGDLIVCVFCGMILLHRDAIDLGYKYKELKCGCGRTIYC
jgi:hypothetical protein